MARMRETKRVWETRKEQVSGDIHADVKRRCESPRVDFIMRSLNLERQIDVYKILIITLIKFRVLRSSSRI